MSFLCDEIMSALPGRTKRSPGGFTTFNGVCCTHNGESRPDTRGRAGIRTNGDGFFYHCFNCGFTTGWEPGRLMGSKTVNLLNWLGFDSERVKFLKYKCWHLQQQMELQGVKPSEVVSNKSIPTFQKADLPKGAKPITFWLNHSTPEFESVLMWLYDRDLDFLDHYDFYWTPDTTDRLNEKVIIPFWFNKELVGYSSRAIYETRMKYIDNKQTSFIFNNNMIYSNREYLFVTEGPFDAIAVEGVALLGNKCNDRQNEWLMSGNKEVVLIPDRDIAGLELVDKALHYKWSVAFPNWDIKIKDCSDAVKVYGRLWTLKTIIESIERNPIKIRNNHKLLANLIGTKKKEVKEKDFSEKMLDKLMRSSLYG